MLLFTLYTALNLLSAVQNVPSEAPKQETIAGAGSYGSITLDAITGAGMVKLNGTWVTNALHVDGTLISSGATIGSLEINGTANLTNSTIQKPSSIVGLLEARGTIFRSDLILSSHKAVLTNCQLQAITVRGGTASFKGKQIIELRQNTTVQGPIVFESGKGEVWIFAPAQALGAIQGGKIVKK